MQYVNPPKKIPNGVFHRTFYSNLAAHEVGYNIYLPPDCETSGRRYPVVYHIHGWTGNESTEIWPTEKVYASRDAITVFPNISLPVDDPENFPIESMLLDELIPYIEREYRTVAVREGRSISGFSMGGGMAFYYAVKHPELFSEVTAYAGTYHHYFAPVSTTVGADSAKAPELRDLILNSSDTGKNILHLLNRSADRIRGTLKIELRVGTEDVLYCDNEIVRLHLESLNIPHEYRRFDGAAHELDKIV